MDENLNLCEILKDFPKGTKLYSTIYGNVEFDYIEEYCRYPIIIKIPKRDSCLALASDGRMKKGYDGECTLFPSKEQRDWSKFKVNKPKFDPKTLMPFDRVLTFETSDKIFTARVASFGIASTLATTRRLDRAVSPTRGWKSRDFRGGEIVIR